MSNKYVGVTLLFASRQEGRLEAWLKSYIIPGTSRQEVVEKADRIRKSQETGRADQPGDFVAYLGLEDVFCVGGPVRHGALLGRTTLWERDTLEGAESLVKQPDDFAFHEQQKDYEGKWYLADPVYFVGLPEEEDLNRSISCHALIESTDQAKVIPRAFAVAESAEFQQQIMACDFEGLRRDQLRFVGFEDIRVVSEDVEKGGAFLFLAREFDSMRKIRALRIKEEELRGFFNEPPPP
jgi:hypothetical protein